MVPKVDALIIGGGPAGLSAALTLARQVHSSIVFSNGLYRNRLTNHMHVVLTWDHHDPAEFRAAARKNILANYDTVRFEDIGIEKVKKTEQGHFEATDANGKTWEGKKLILATGVQDIFPKIDGYEDCWVKGIFHCFFCKGYEERGAQSSGVLAIDFLANPNFALHVARHASPFSKSVNIYTHGNAELASQIAAGFGTAKNFAVDSRKIKRLVKGPHKAEIIVQFEDGTEVTEGFLGHAPMTKPQGPFAEQLGLELTKSGDVMVKQPFLQTSVEGVYACGDCATPMKTAVTAMNMGGMVGAGLSGEITAEEMGQETLRFG